jgi:pilus assembly protein CpaF
MALECFKISPEMSKNMSHEMNTATPHWLAHALARPDVTDICLNGANEAFADWGAGLIPIALAEGERAWTEEQMRDWVLGQLALAGKSWDARHPFIDAALPSGHRLHVAFPPLARQGILVSLRRLASAGRSPGSAPQADGFSRWGRSPLYARLRQAVREGDSILISGATGSGKTTLASDLLSEVPHHERMLALEDTPELSPPHPHFVSLTSRPPNADGFGEVTLRTLLKQALRMRPDRVILGECRGGEVLDLLQALNTGHRGSLATLHANSPRDALRRVELLCLLAAQGAVPISAIRELLSAGVQWVAQVRRVATGGSENGVMHREIQELWHIEGREGDTILMRPVVKAWGECIEQPGLEPAESQNTRRLS